MDKTVSKVGITGKYGTRYGAKLRKQAKAIEMLRRTKFISPFCGKQSMKRVAVGIWRCKTTNRKIAGGAWELNTTAAITAKTTIHRLKRIANELKKGEEVVKDTDEVENKEAKKERKEKKEKKEKKDKVEKTEKRHEGKTQVKRGGK